MNLRSQSSLAALRDALAALTLHNLLESKETLDALIVFVKSGSSEQRDDLLNVLRGRSQGTSRDERNPVTRTSVGTVQKVKKPPARLNRNAPQQITGSAPGEPTEGVSSHRSSPNNNPQDHPPHLQESNASGENDHNTSLEACISPDDLIQEDRSTVSDMEDSENLSLTEYCKVNAASSKRVGYVVKALHRMIQAPRIADEDYSVLWESQAPIFNRQGPRLNRLLQGISTIDRNHELNDCAQRLALLFFQYELKLQTEKLQAIPQPRRQNVKSAALQSLAETTELELQKIQDLNKRSKRYLTWVNIAGPGAILELGKEVSWMASWQKCLEDDDLHLILRYISDHQADVRNRQVVLDEIAVEVIISGMKAYGWETTSLFGRSSSILGPERNWPSQLRKRHRSSNRNDSLDVRRRRMNPADDAANGQQLDGSQDRETCSPVDELALASDLSLTNNPSI